MINLVIIQHLDALNISTFWVFSRVVNILLLSAILKMKETRVYFLSQVLYSFLGEGSLVFLGQEPVVDCVAWLHKGSWVAHH